LGDDGKLRRDGQVVHILAENMKLLVECGKDALLNVHEDVTSTGFYLYVMGDAQSPVVRLVLSAGKKTFGYKENGVYTDNGTYTLEDGVVDNHSDGSLDECMHRAGVPLAVNLEFPGKDTPLMDRAVGGSELIREFLAGVLG
jgi:hypothetical protein